MKYFDMKLGLIIFGCMMVRFAVCKKFSSTEVDKYFRRIKDGLGQLNRTLHSESLINDRATQDMNFLENSTLDELQLSRYKKDCSKCRKLDQNVCMMAKLLESVGAMFTVLSEAEKKKQIFNDPNIATTLLSITNDTLTPLTRLTRGCSKRKKSVKAPSCNSTDYFSMVARLVVRDARRVAAVAATFFQENCNVSEQSLKCTDGHITNLWGNFTAEMNLQNAQTVPFCSPGGTQGSRKGKDKISDKRNKKGKSQKNKMRKKQKKN